MENNIYDCGFIFMPLYQICWLVWNEVYVVDHKKII